MCRNIKRLRRPGEQPTDEELRNAALQFVRKISGYNAPSQANREAFDGAVRDVAEAGRRLFESLIPNPSSRIANRESRILNPGSSRITDQG
jgi:hypothetical protein